MILSIVYQLTYQLMVAQMVAILKCCEILGNLYLYSLVVDQNSDCDELVKASLVDNRPLTRIWSLPKCKVWYETELPTFDDRRFKKHFRVTKELFQQLCTDLKPLLQYQDTNMRKAIPLEKKVLIGLFRLGSTSELRCASELFGVGISTVAAIQHCFTKAVIHIYKQKIQWPTSNEDLKKTARDFNDLWNYPCCIGAIDGCHIPCSPPTEDAVDYHNYKGFYAHYKFTYFNVGSPGRVNDGFIFRYSNLKKKLDTQEKTLQELGLGFDSVQIPLHLIGDGGFPLLNYIMKPYPRVSNLTAIQKQFNYRLSRARRVIENAFGRLKLRFRFLLKRMEISIYNINETIHACALLHNLCEERKDAILPEWASNVDGFSQVLAQNLTLSPADRPTARPAIDIRNALSNYFGQIE